MEETLQSIVVEDSGRILINWSDGTGLEFPDISSLQLYISAVLSQEAIRRIIIAKLFIDNQIISSDNPKKYTLTMTGTPTLTNV